MTIMFELGRIIKIGEFVAPKWWECQWRRVACGRDECPMCRHIKRDRQKHIERGEDPDSWKAAFEDVGNTLTETIRLIHQHAQERGIDLNAVDDSEIDRDPEPESFPLFQQTKEWEIQLEEILERSASVGEEWIESDAGLDLGWYALYIPKKTYRALAALGHGSRPGSQGC